MIYLDYAATTPVAPEVCDAMLPWLRADFGNPASLTHSIGRKAFSAVEQSRETVARLIGADARDIVWTSGATESNNLAIKGVADAYQAQGKHMVSVRTEHKSVLDPLRHLETRGWRVAWLTPDANGRIDPNHIAQALTADTVLVSVMLVNNEIGVMQDIPAIAAQVHARGALLHVDAAQAVGKIPVDVQTLDVDLLSFSAHKLYGPKGVGALYLRRQPRPRLTPQMLGGGHERGLRSGTLPTHQIAGFAAACQRAAREQAQDYAWAKILRQIFCDGLLSVPGIHLNGHSEHQIPHILSLTVTGVDGESLFSAMEQESLAVSAGSACTAASGESSYVLRALGRSDELAYATLRLSFGAMTTTAEVDAAVAGIRRQVTRLRALSPKDDGSRGYDRTL